MHNNKHSLNKVDWITTLLPIISIVGLSIVFFMYPEKSNKVIEGVRYVFGDVLGSYYLVIGLGVFAISIYVAFSKYGKIVLGNQDEKPKYSFWAWGSMMFTAGLAADILFYSFSEWLLYATDYYVQGKGPMTVWASVYPIFHWSLIPWGFYLMLAVSFGFMLHVRKRERQKYSEACRAILGKHTEGILGRLIDLLAVFALLAGTATTFSVATPLMTSIIEALTGIVINKTFVTILILAITCAVYTFSLLHGFKGISILAKACIYLFYGLIAYVFFFGGETRFIIETGLMSIGTMLSNFIELATYTDPLRENCFPQNWTIFYWAYWMVWCVAAPFFIGTISKGRTIKQTIIGGYVFGVGSTIISFVVLGNYSLGREVSGDSSFIASYVETGDLYSTIINIINSLPLSPLVLVLVFITMATLYATSFDSIAYIGACYSYKKLGNEEQPHKMIQLVWCIMLIVFPMALVFSESSMSNLQSVSIIAAFPIGIVIVLIVASFLLDIKRYVNQDN